MRHLPLAVFLLLSLFLTACQSPPSAPSLSGEGLEMFAPTKMRLYPLTRIVLPTPASTTPATAPAASAPAAVPTLEARIELSDQFGDPCKGAGTVALQLFDASAPSLNRKPIVSWTFSLMTPQENRDHWDRTTRTYLFRISLPSDFSPPAGHNRFQLSATFASPGNASLSDTLQLQTK